MRTISKGELCKILDLYSARSGRLYYRTLNTQYFTDEVLSQLQLSREKYRRIKIFSAAQTLKIRQIFKIGEGQGSG